MPRPYVIIYFTESIDGRIASRTGYSKLSCPYDLKRLHSVRAQVDAVVVGANTARVDNPKLTVRLVEGRNPIRVVISASGDLSPSLNLFEVPPRTVVYTTSMPLDVERSLKDKGVDVVRTGVISACKIVEDLGQRFSVRRVLIEGGGKTVWTFIKESCFDELRVTISPVVFGSGRSSVEGEGFDEGKALRLDSFLLCECGQEVHLVYKIFDNK